MSGKVVEYKGIKYPSIKALCDELSRDYNLVRIRLNRGYCLEDALCEVKKMPNKPVIYEGKKYDSIYSFCKLYKLNYKLVLRRLREGMTLEEALSKPKRVCSHETYYRGKFYSDVSELCDELGVDTRLVRGRLKYGKSIEEAVETKLQPVGGIEVGYGGKVYKSIHDFYNSCDFNVSYVSVVKWLDKGYSADECIVLQDISLKKKFDNFYECKCRHCSLKFVGTLEIAEKHASEHKEDYENMILSCIDEELRG